MRKFLLSLVVVGSFAGVAGAADAAPVAIAPAVSAPAQLQTVQYWGPGARHEYWRHRRWERRREAWRYRHWGRPHVWAGRGW